MLPDFATYIPGQTPVLARDMNTAGEMVRIFNNLSGPLMFRDATGVHFRRQILPVPEEDAPEFFGQVHMGVANLTPGWALLPLVNIVP